VRVRPDFLQPILSVLVFRGCLTAATVPAFQVQCIGEEDRLDLFLQGSNLGFAHGRLTRLHGPGLHSWPEGDGYPGEEPMLLRRNVTQLGRLWETAGCGRFHATFAQLSPFGLHSPRPMAFQPMSLSRRPLPFDHPEWIFELKYDRFRSLAVIQNGRTKLIPRNGNPFNSFADLIKRRAWSGAPRSSLSLGPLLPPRRLICCQLASLSRRSPKSSRVHAW
jgi:hypothetical protein